MLKFSSPLERLEVANQVIQEDAIFSPLSILIVKFRELKKANAKSTTNKILPKIINNSCFIFYFQHNFLIYIKISFWIPFSLDL